ncbi:MAG: MBL fold metallo-hydrolase [Actinomycetales bacterium]
MADASGLDWTAPGAYEVSPGVHRIPLPLPTDGLRAVNVYCMETEHGLTLIDGGWAIEPARRDLERALASIGRHPRDITSFLVTHSHRDHYTQAVSIRREFGRAVVSLGTGDKPTIDLASSGADFPYDARLRACGAFDVARTWGEWAGENRPVAADWQPPDRWLDGEQTLTVGSRTLQAVPTPGHTAGHFVFADHQAGVLFAGDHVLPTITPSVGFDGAPDTLPLVDYLASLATVRALADLRLLPAHGDVGGSTHRRIDELLAHHEVRLALSLQAVRAGSRTPFEVARTLPWTGRQRAFDELGVFDAGLAVMETKAHLDVLQTRAEVSREIEDGLWMYDVLPRPATD